MGRDSKYSLSRWEAAAAAAVVASFGLVLLAVYLSMPSSDYSFLKLPRTVEDIQDLRDNLESYASDYTIQVLVGYCTVYIFMQTFMIPGTIFMSLLAGALFGVLRGVALVVFAATAGASSCYFLSYLIGRPLVFSLWPDKLSFFQEQAGIALGELRSVADLYDFQAIATLFFIGIVSVTPTLINKSQTVNDA
ncbi:SNARE associated Golgi protein [Musa troglodytarum]|uniref:SNARE associated Golgi protein n=1 Tax=Musa troglodytarum TaxID=320322 RepID=A0A9E7FDC4_9LILI|nr:SNARE associated Golgi protein [Musa troglodytarum]